MNLQEHPLRSSAPQGVWHAPAHPALNGVRALVFDMDGTMLNTAHVITQAASCALQHWGHTALPADYVMPNMHGTAADLMADVLAERGLPLPEGGAVEAGAVFERCYAQQPASLAPLYDGVRELLEAAHAQGVALAVCTNKQAALAVQGVQANGLEGMLRVVTGRDSCGIAKPAPQPLWFTLEQLQVAPQDALFVGDTHADAACAHAAGVRFAWFSQGFGGPEVHAYPRVWAFDDYRAWLQAPSAVPTPATVACQAHGSAVPAAS